MPERAMDRNRRFIKLSARPDEDEVKALQQLERDGGKAAFEKSIAAFDRKYTTVSLDQLAIDPKVINRRRLRSLSLHAIQPNAAFVGSSMANPGAMATIAAALGDRRAACDCIAPFAFAGVMAFSEMTGPNVDDVRLGLLGANRQYDDEYTTANWGETSGKTRVAVGGELYISFEAAIPSAGQWCIIHPGGSLILQGDTRVVGHGNMTTSYDAKVWVSLLSVLGYDGGGDGGASEIIEISGGQIHYDGTRSEDRTTSFDGSCFIEPNYLFFNTHGPGGLYLDLRVEVSAEANEDGVAICHVNRFGFLANSKRDYDTFILRAH